MFNVEEVRKDFPILNTGLAYLDNTASSLTPEPVLQKMLEFYRQFRSNIERGVHRLSQKASEEHEQARLKVMNFVNARSEAEIIMTKNATEGINIIASGLKIHKGEKIVTSILEHHSNFVVWLRVKERHGAIMEVIEPHNPSDQGILNPADFEKAIDDNTRLVAITHVSNVLGAITPVREIAKIAHEHGALVLVDGAQSVPHMKIDIKDIGCDFLAFSGHKLCAPTGSGALYIREELTEQIEPLCVGGGSIIDVDVDSYKLGKSPTRFEAGTPAIAETIGLGAAIEYLEKIGMDNIENYERVLTRQMYNGLKSIPKVELYGPGLEHRIGIISFNVGGLNHHDVALALDISADIMVRSGHHCALPLSKSLIRRPGTVRASTYFYNTKEEINKLISAVEEIAKSLTN